ncbi:MAG TPA: glycosyltransferase, partial [bacterium]|nr:glycosyltransferase [bacterium]
MKKNNNNNNSIKIEDYKDIIGADMMHALICIAKRLKGIKVQHINSTKIGGGVAEILYRMAPLMNGLGINTSWDVINVKDSRFYDVTKKIHNTLQGENLEFSAEEWDLYFKVQQQNSKVIDKTADVVFIHDPQPLGLIKYRRMHQKFIWRCHIDMSNANYKVWQKLRGMAEKYDAAIFHTQYFAKELSIPLYILGPSIDPLSDKNKPLEQQFVKKVLKDYHINPQKPIILQVSRFDRFKDPIGVIMAYQMVKKEIDCQLILAGGAADDDPEGIEVYNEIIKFAQDDKDIHILNLPPDSHLIINALQCAADVILQKSLKEGFGLTVSEALWKKKPVIAGNVGGIKKQMIDNVTGFLVNTVEGCAYSIRQLLNSKDISAKMGKLGHEYIKENFILPVHLR